MLCTGAWSQSLDGGCGICLCPLILDGDGRQWLQCGHCFHESCIEDLRRCGVQSLCPACRAPDEQLSTISEMRDEAARLYVKARKDVSKAEKCQAHLRQLLDLDQSDVLGNLLLGLI